jgi:hypothetical protein
MIIEFPDCWSKPTVTFVVLHPITLVAAGWVAVEVLVLVAVAVIVGVLEGV